MKTLKLIIATALIILASSTIQAADYTLKRAVVTWNGGIVDDSALGAFSVVGLMSINGDVIKQDITFCSKKTCTPVVNSGSGRIIDVEGNAARITLRRADGSIGELTILTLNPNIITLFVYNDGTAEAHEWEPIK